MIDRILGNERVSEACGPGYLTAATTGGGLPRHRTPRRGGGGRQGSASDHRRIGGQLGDALLGAPGSPLPPVRAIVPDGIGRSPAPTQFRSVAFGPALHPAYLSGTGEGLWLPGDDGASAARGPGDGVRPEEAALVYGNPGSRLRPVIGVG